MHWSDVYNDACEVSAMDDDAPPTYDIDFSTLVVQQPKRKKVKRSVESENEDYVNNIVEVTFTEDDRKEAEQWAKELGELHNSIMRGKGNVVGRIGEILVARYVNGKIMDDYNFDILTPDGKKLEVKTKHTTMKTPPRLHYENSVAKYNYKQNADMYVFVRVSTKVNKAWILGQLSPKAYKEKARLLKRGDFDERNNYVVRADCFNVDIGCLEKLEPASGEPEAL